MAQSATVDVRGCKINFRRSGQGKPLLFLHGAQGINGNERGLDALAKRFDVIAPDRPAPTRRDNGCRAALPHAIRDVAARERGHARASGPEGMEVRAAE
jgi:pimeloyl-ACP methyl ester carboxylesterase